MREAKAVTAKADEQNLTGVTCAVTSHLCQPTHLGKQQASPSIGAKIAFNPTCACVATESAAEDS